MSHSAKNATHPGWSVAEFARRWRDPFSRASRMVLLAALPVMVGAPASAADVDLWITYDVPTASSGGTALSTLTIGNAGSSASGVVRLTFATPAFVNIDRGQPLPAGCAFVYENLDRTVPEVVGCVLPGLAANASRNLVFGVAVHATAPPITTWGMALILPAIGSPDHELYMTDNVTTPGVNVARLGPIGSGTINLYLAGDLPSVSQSAGGTQSFIVGNHGPGPTTGPVTLTMTTPFFVNFDHSRPLPGGCGYLLQNADPAIPEIVRCTLPPGLAVGSAVTIQLPLALVPGGPIGAEYSIAAVATGAGSPDVDPDRTDNVFEPGALVLTPPVSALARSGRAVLPRRTASAARMPADESQMSVASTAVLAAAPARIDLGLSFDVPAAQPGTHVTERFFISNRGQSSTGPVRLIFALPGFINVDRGGALPAGCVFLYENADFTVNEILACTLPGVARGQTITLPIPLDVSPDAPGVLVFGTANVGPAPGSADREQFLGDNIGTPGVTVGGGSPVPIAPGNRVDLYVTGDMPDILPNAAGIVTFKIGNKGPAATQGVTRLTFITPPFVNIDREQPLPAGCSFLYENQDPAVAEVVECLVPTAIGPGAELLIPVSVRRVPGGPPGQVWSTMVVRPQGGMGPGDVEVDLTDNFFAHGVVTSRPLPHSVQLFLHPDFTLRLSPPAPQLLGVNLVNAPSWLSQPLFNGLFEPEVTFRVITPCTLGLGVAVTYALSATDAAGGSAQPLGQTTLPVSLCLGTRVVAIPVVGPIALGNQRVKLTISSAIGLTLNLQLGAGASLNASNFAGLP